MPTANPCVQCKEKHVRCDEQRPRCTKCEKKNLDCTRPSKVTIFRHDAMSTFANDQKWVNSQARKSPVEEQLPNMLWTVQFDHHTQQDLSFPSPPIASPSFASPSVDTGDDSSPRFMSEQDASPAADDLAPSQSTVSSPERSHRTSSSMSTSKRRRSETVATPGSDAKMDQVMPLPSPSQLQLQLQHPHAQFHQPPPQPYYYQQHQQPLTVMGPSLQEGPPHELAWPQPQQLPPQPMYPMYVVAPPPQDDAAAHGAAVTLAPMDAKRTQAKSQEPEQSSINGALPQAVPMEPVLVVDPVPIPIEPGLGWPTPHVMPPSHSDTSHPSHHTIQATARSSPSGVPAPAPTPTAPPEKYVDEPPPKFPLENKQEACLLRYYIEVIAHWLDLADPDQHFERVVPQMARNYAHLLHAILAVSARHIIRMPQYRTERGLEYHGQLLTNLTRTSAIEYMLKSIPALKHIEDRGQDYLESVVATAVLLRQLEEIDDDDDDIHPPLARRIISEQWKDKREPSGDHGGSHDGHPYHAHSLPPSHPHPHNDHHHHHHHNRHLFSPPAQGGSDVQETNCLHIMESVLRRRVSRKFLMASKLMQAAYWTALRQEICHAFTQQEAPKIGVHEDVCKDMSDVNRAVLHTVVVARWKWGDKGENPQASWNQLMEQQVKLEDEVIAKLQPIYRRDADPTRNEIFPVIWYSSNIEVTTVQQALMARSVLVAEDPSIKSEHASRASWRRMETEVRRVIKELCGVGVCNPHSPPALLHTVLLVRTYGDYFTEPHERDAIKRMVERYRDTRAWPAKALLGIFDA